MLAPPEYEAVNLTEMTTISHGNGVSNGDAHFEGVSDQHSADGGDSHRNRPQNRMDTSVNGADGDAEAAFLDETADMQKMPTSLDATADPKVPMSLDAITLSHDKHPHDFKIGSVPLAVMVFYSVSGGPFGVEPAVRAAGNFYALLGFAIAPVVWSIPEALITAELGSAYPEASGGVAWVEEAFGSTAGFVMGYFTWISGATDNAIYPVLFLEYLTQIMSSGGADESDSSDGGISDLERFLFLAGTSIVLALINFMGLQVVGKVSIVICIISLSPFVLLCILGIPKVDPSRWFQTPDTDVQFDDDSLGQTGWLPVINFAGVLWRPFLNNLYWNLNSFDNAGSFAGEVRDPGTVFPRAMFMAILLVVVSYFVPLLIAMGASDSTQKDWVDGYLAKICTEVGGPWLGGWTVFAAGISNIALFESEMSSDAFQIMGMAERGLMPKIFTKKNRFGTPTNGILLGTLVIICMSVADFSALVELLNFNYTVALLMEYSAFIKLRISEPDVPRPYRVPLSTAAAIVALLPTFTLCLFIMALGSYTTYIYFCLVALVGFILWKVQSCGKDAVVCEYTQDDEDTIDDSGHEADPIIA